MNQFKSIEKLPEADKIVVKVFLDAFITKKKPKQLVLKNKKPGNAGLSPEFNSILRDFITSTLNNFIYKMDKYCD